MEETRARTELLAAAGFSLLGVLVLGPLVLPGYLLLLDFPSGPSARWISLFPLPSQGIIATGAPLLAALRFISLATPQLTPKLIIVLVIVLAGVGMVRFVVFYADISLAAACVGGSLFAINPFVYDRVLAGQLLVLLAYALLPWALPSFLRLALGGSTSSLLRGIGWVALISLVNLQVGTGALLLLVASLWIEPASLRIKGLHLGVALLALAALHLYWLLPFLLTSTSHALGPSDISVYATRPHSAAVLMHVLLLHGFWRPEFKAPLRDYPVVFLLTFTPLLVAVGVGVIAAMGSERFRRPATALGIACLIALVLAMGTSFPPTASLSRLLFEHVAAYSLFREPQKWVSLVALGYAVFAAAGMDAARTVGARLRIPMHDVVFLGLALPLIATHVMLWGLGGQVETSAFPRAWAQAEAAIRGKPGKLLFLPWHLYEPLPFAGNRVLANPAPDYFSLPTLISTRAQLSTRRSVAATDPATQYVDELLRHRSDLRYFGHLIAPLGVHYVALASVADAPTYHFLASQRDLRSLFTTGSLTLYDNTAFRGSLYNIHQRVASRSIRQLLASPTMQRKTSYFLNATSGSVEGIKGPSETRALPLWQRVSSSRRGYLGTDLSCADGWRLGSSVPVCNLGAVAAFRKNTRQAVLWRPGFGTQILGYAVSSVALLALVLGCWGTRNQLPGTSRAGA